MAIDRTVFNTWVDDRISAGNGTTFGKAEIAAGLLDPIDAAIAVGPTPLQAVVYHNATQSVATATLVTMSFNSEDVDVTAMHDTVTNNSRVTVPTGGGGLYLVVGKIYYATLTATDVRARIHKNGSMVGSEVVAQNSGAPMAVMNMLVLVLAATDYIELVAYQNSGGSINAGNASRGNANELSVVRLR